MKLLMISGDRALASGKQGAFWNTLEELHKHFDRIDVICPRVPVRRYDMILFGNVHVHPSPWPLFLQPLWILMRGRQLFSDVHFSVFTCHDYPPFYNGLGAFLLRMVTGVPYLLEIFHIPGYPHPTSWKDRVWRWWATLFIRFTVIPTAAVRVMNDEVSRFLVHHGVSREKIKRVPAVYLDREVFKPTDTLKQYDLVFVGRLVHNKGIDLFLEVVRMTGLKALIVGDGPLREKLETRNSKLETHADFVGFAKDAEAVARYLNESRLLLMTSYSEGGPRVVVEAMACGVPVVATPVGIVPDILPPECIEDWDTQALADKVKNILHDRELYERLRVSGLQVVEQCERHGAIAVYANLLKEMA